MNRFKKEIRRRGIKLECDYEFLPYNSIETVEANAEDATIRTYHDCYGWSCIKMARTGDLIDMDSEYTMENFYGDEAHIYGTVDGRKALLVLPDDHRPRMRWFADWDHAYGRAYNLGYRA